MSKFDWEQFPEAKEKNSFNWDQFSDAPTEELSRSSDVESAAKAAEAGLMHGIQSASGGFLDETSGGLEGLGRVAGIEGLGGKFSDVKKSEQGPTVDWETLRDAYREARDRKRNTLNKLSDEHPAASNIGSLAGMIASPINKVAGGMSLAKGGMALGGINALGNSESDTIGGMAGDTALGVGLGGIIGKGVDKASPYLSKASDYVGNKLSSAAESLMARDLGAERGTIKSLGMKKVKQAGRYALDNPLTGALGNTDDMIQSNLANKAAGGEMMGKAYQAIDDAGASSFNPEQVASKIDDQIGGFYRSPINRGETNQLENTLESVRMRGKDHIPLSEAQNLKEELGKVANWKNTLNPTDKEKMAREAYRVANGAIDDAVAKGSEAVGNAGLSDVLKKGKDLYGNASTTEKLLENKSARETGNKFMGMTDAIMGAGSLGYGGATGDWKTAGGIMLAKKGLEKYGARAAARGVDNISKFLLKSPKMAELYGRNPEAFQAIATSLEKRAGAFSKAPMKAAEQQNALPDKTSLLEKTQGSKYGQVLQNAAQKSDQSFAAAHYVLSSRDENYRKLLEGNQDDLDQEPESSP